MLGKVVLWSVAGAFVASLVEARPVSGAVVGGSIALLTSKPERRASALGAWPDGPVKTRAEAISAVRQALARASSEDLAHTSELLAAAKEAKNLTGSIDQVFSWGWAKLTHAPKAKSWLTPHIAGYREWIKASTQAAPSASTTTDETTGKRKRRSKRVKKERTGEGLSKLLDLVGGALDARSSARAAASESEAAADATAPSEASASEGGARWAVWLGVGLVAVAVITGGVVIASGRRPR